MLSKGFERIERAGEGKIEEKVKQKKKKRGEYEMMQEEVEQQKKEEYEMREEEVVQQKRAEHMDEEKAAQRQAVNEREEWRDYGYDVDDENGESQKKGYCKKKEKREKG